MIDAILEEDQSKPAKQRHTAQRIFDRLRAEHGFTGGYTIVKDYVRAADAAPAARCSFRWRMRRGRRRPTSARRW